MSTTPLKYLRALPLFLLLAGYGQPSMAQELPDPWRGQYRATCETVLLPQNEKMGLAGFNYLIDVSPWLYAGVGAYGAVAGKRGGFFTGGLATGTRQRFFRSFSIDAGVFIGGGGGGSAPQGGGLMIRPHIGLLYDLARYRLGLHYAMVDFPDGRIRSDHIGFSFEVPFEMPWLLAGHSGNLPGKPGNAEREILFSKNYFAALYQIYTPLNGAMNTDGITATEQVELIGFEYGRQVNGNVSFFVETAGAVGGSSDGYAEIFLGFGYAYPLIGNSGDGDRGILKLDGRIAAGAAGGGGVDTGGGSAVKAALGLTYQVTENFTLSASGGYLDAIDGGFQARTVNVQFAYSADFADFGKTGLRRGAQTENLRFQNWGVGLTLQTYGTLQPSMRTDLRDAPLSLAGFTIDAYISEHLYATGQALGAFTGHAGGYAVGLIGLGYRSGALFDSRTRLFIEALAGASGGGGISVGGGAVVQPLAGMSCDIGSALTIEASAGRIKALRGELDSTVVNVGFTYRFSTLGR